LTNPDAASPAVHVPADRIGHLTHRRNHAKIAGEPDAANANMMTFPNNDRNRVPPDRVPYLPREIEVDPASLTCLPLNWRSARRRAASSRRSSGSRSRRTRCPECTRSRMRRATPVRHPRRRRCRLFAWSMRVAVARTGKRRRVGLAANKRGACDIVARDATSRKG
jgi:hypothetical protein